MFGVNWHELPFVRLLLPFIAGILSAVYFPFSWTWLLSGLFFLLLLYLFLDRISHQYKWRWTYGFGVFLLLYGFGGSLTYLHTEIHFNSHYSQHLQPGAQKALIQLEEPPIPKKNSYKATATVLQLQKDTTTKQMSGTVLLYFENDTSLSQLEYGDVLLTVLHPAPIKPPQNPFQFDYQEYMGFHHIHHRAFLETKDWENTGLNQGNQIRGMAYQLQYYFLDKIDTYLHDQREISVASAILLGYKDELKDSLTKAYASSGAMHVLAVSGLHVGLIYLVLSSLFHFLQWIRYGRFLKALLLLSGIWMFAMITGLRPSVLRASTMFSFIVLGSAFKRYTNIFNTLAASAFFLLLLNPYLIMEVGFQLSYLAVIGIVYLQPKIYEQWNAPNYLLDKIWAITAVSIAAQVATFPLALLYFHMFPTLFPVSNLVVIPAATLILYGGVFLLGVSFLPSLAYYVGWCLEGLISLLNTSILHLQQLPYSRIDGITITVVETWLIYFLIIGIIGFWQYKRPQFLQVALTIAVLLAGYNVYEKYNRINQEKFIVYQVPGHSAYDFIKGQETTFLADSGLINQPSQLLFYVKHHWWGARINQVKQKSIQKLQNTPTLHTSTIRGKGPVFQYDTCTILRVTQSLPIQQSPVFSNIDYLLITESTPSEQLEPLLQKTEPQKVIIDSSTPHWLAEKCQQKCQQLSISSYDVNEEGAFITTL